MTTLPIHCVWRPTEDEDEVNPAWDALLSAHEEAITEAFGEEAMLACNLDWAIDETSITAKVYGLGFVTTHFNPETFEPEDTEISEMNAD